MKVALAQINTTVGDIDGNARRMAERIKTAEAEGAELIVFPELAIFGYPPQDLLRRHDLIRRNEQVLHQLASSCTRLAAVIGFVQTDPRGDGKGVCNAAALCSDGKVQTCYAKMLLPTYDVFDESRYFNPGTQAQTAPVILDGRELRIGLTICEDLWNDRQFEDRPVYHLDPIGQTVAAGAQLLVNLSGSPFRAGVQVQRERLFAQQVRDYGVPLLYVNLVGGNDDLIFDGASLALAADGSVLARAKSFAEDLLILDLSDASPSRITPLLDRVASIHHALVLGIRDYLRKCDFDDVILGLSGGVDSAVTAVLAVEALGAEHVRGVALPSRYSSAHSVEDARELARLLGIDFSVIAIEDVHRAMEAAVQPYFDQTPPGTAEENIQARIRGNLLMALSNKLGCLLLMTGNKSELAVGYCTLYGDMCGGLAVLSDVPKTVVYDLAHHLNAQAPQPRIPPRTIDKPPSAELREGQTDQQTLPSYDVLDAILEQYVEQDRTVEEMVASGLDRPAVEQIARMVERSEYKRKQAPVGLKVTSRAFGIGRRMPIAAKFQ